MSIFQCNFFSKCLGNFVDVTVYVPSYHNGDISMGNLPLEKIYNKEQRFKTIYLLHGMLDDHSSWMRWSMVEEQICAGDAFRPERILHKCGTRTCLL